MSIVNGADVKRALLELDAIRRESTDPVVIGLVSSIDDFISDAEQSQNLAHSQFTKTLKKMMQRLKGHTR